MKVCVTVLRCKLFYFECNRLEISPDGIYLFYCVLFTHFENISTLFQQYAFLLYLFLLFFFFFCDCSSLYVWIYFIFLLWFLYLLGNAVVFRTHPSNERKKFLFRLRYSVDGSFRRFLPVLAFSEIGDFSRKRNIKKKCYCLRKNTAYHSSGGAHVRKRCRCEKLRLQF